MLVDMATSGSHPSVHTAPPQPCPRGDWRDEEKVPWTALSSAWSVP